MGKLLKRWDSLTDEEIKKMPPAELVKGIFACTKAREKAAGLPQVFKLNVPAGALSEVEERALEQEKNAEFEQWLIELIETMKDEDAIDV